MEGQPAEGSLELRDGCGSFSFALPALLCSRPLTTEGPGPHPTDCALCYLSRPYNGPQVALLCDLHPRMLGMETNRPTPGVSCDCDQQGHHRHAQISGSSVISSHC